MKRSYYTIIEQLLRSLCVEQILKLTVQALLCGHTVAVAGSEYHC